MTIRKNGGPTVTTIPIVRDMKDLCPMRANVPVAAARVKCPIRNLGMRRMFRVTEFEMMDKKKENT